MRRLLCLILVHGANGGIVFNGTEIETHVCPFSSFIGIQNLDTIVDIQIISAGDWKLANQAFLDWDPSTPDDFILNEFLVHKYSSAVALEAYTITREADSEGYSSKVQAYTTESAVFLSKQFPAGFIISHYSNSCSTAGWFTSFWGDAVPKGGLQHWTMGVSCESELLLQHISNGQLRFPNASFVLDSNPYREFFDAPGTQLMSRYLISFLFFAISFASFRIAYHRKTKVPNTSPLIMAVLLVNGAHSTILGIVLLLDGCRTTAFLPHRFTWAFASGMFITTVGTDFMISSLWTQLRTKNKSRYGLFIGFGFVFLDIVSIFTFLFVPDFITIGTLFSIFVALIQLWIIIRVSYSTLKFLYDFHEQIQYAKDEIEFKMNTLFRRAAKALLLAMFAATLRLIILLLYIKGVHYQSPLWDRIIMCGFLYAKIVTMFAQNMVCQVPVTSRVTRVVHNKVNILPMNSTESIMK